MLKRVCNPPEVETYSIAQTGMDLETRKDTIAVDGVTFYNFNGQSGLLDEFYALQKSGR